MKSTSHIQASGATKDVTPILRKVRVVGWRAALHLVPLFLGLLFHSQALAEAPASVYSCNVDCSIPLIQEETKRILMRKLRIRDYSGESYLCEYGSDVCWARMRAAQNQLAYIEFIFYIPKELSDSEYISAAIESDSGRFHFNSPNFSESVREGSYREHQVFRLKRSYDPLSDNSLVAMNKLYSLLSAEDTEFVVVLETEESMSKFNLGLSDRVSLINILLLWRSYYDQPRHWIVE